MNIPRYRYELTLMSLAFALLMFAIFVHPTIQLKREIHSYFLVADISQSMNVEDLKVDLKPVTRLAYTRQMLHEIVSRLPCDSYVSIGLFAGSGIAALYTPLHVCENFSEIHDTIDHIDWRNAWSANSRIRESITSLTTVLSSFPEPSQVIYFTDGEESPKLHVFNTKNLKDFQGGAGWLFVGIGSLKGGPIPKYSEQNQLIGYWANDSFAVQPGISQISEGNLGARDTSIAMTGTDRFISKLDERYLRSLAKELGSQYITGNDVDKVLNRMQKYQSQRYKEAKFDLSWIMAAIAGLLFLNSYIYFPNSKLVKT